MPDLYIAPEYLQNKINGLVNGFFIEIDEDGTPIIFIKFEPSVLSDLISGCNFEFVVRNPKLSNRSVTLYVYDNLKDPLWVTYSKFSEEDTVFVNFDKSVINFIKAESFRIVYYNHFNLPIFTTVLIKENAFNKFCEWVIEIYKDLEVYEEVTDGYFSPENSQKGFKLLINNIDNSNVEKLNIFSYPIDEQSQGENNIFHYNFDEFQKNGKHGYDQENNVQFFLSNFFDENIDLFTSLHNSRNEEIKDFAIINKNAIVLIESKAVKSNKQSKVTQAIVKAINQLNRVENKVLNKNIESTNSNFESKYQDCDVIIKICLINDSTSTNLLREGNYIDNFTREELPIFISVTTFFQLLGDFSINFKGDIKTNLIQNLLNNYYHHLDNTNDEYLLIREYKKK
ncbi:hypothetical protein ACK2M7_14255 [Chryseobacterium sp. TY4]